MISTKIVIMPFQFGLGFVGSKINCSRKLPSKFTVEKCVPFFRQCSFNFFFRFFEGQRVHKISLLDSCLITCISSFHFRFISFRLYILYRKRILLFKLQSGTYFYSFLCQISKRILENNFAVVSFSFSVCLQFFFVFFSLSKGGQGQCYQKRNYLYARYSNNKTIKKFVLSKFDSTFSLQIKKELLNVKNKVSLLLLSLAIQQIQF